MKHATSITKIRLHKGDSVIVRVGKDKGKIGKITATHPKTNSVTVDGINIAKKHVKPSKTYPQGGIIELTRPINVSKVAAYDNATKKASKIGYKVEAGKKIRIYKRTGKEIK